MGLFSEKSGIDLTNKNNFYVLLLCSGGEPSLNYCSPLSSTIKNIYGYKYVQ